MRTGLVASTAFLLAAGAHVGAGGRVPSGIGLVALLTLTVVVAATVSRWRLRVSVLAPVAGLLQLVLHHGFDWFSASAAAGTVGAPGMTGMTGMTPTAGQLAALAGPGAHPSAPAAHMTMTGGGPMLWAHVVGTLLTTVLLVLGDRAAERTLVWWTAVLPALLAVAGQPVRPVLRTSVDRVVPVLRTLVVGGGTGRRGPPRRDVAPAPHAFAPAAA